MLIPGKILEQIINQSMFKYLEYTEAIRSSWHGFVKNISHPTNLISFLDSISGLIDKEATTDLICFDFC